MSYIKTDYKPFVDWMKETFRRLGEDCLVREICAINDERVDNLLRSGFMKGVMNAYSFKPTGGTNVFKEVDMNERMTRKELTTAVKKLLQALEGQQRNAEGLLKNMKALEKVVYRQEETSTPWDRFSALIEFLGLESQYVCGTDGHYEFKKKKVRKPYVRKKQ